MSKIDIVTFIGNNSAGYAEFLKHTMVATRSGNHALRWMAIRTDESKMPAGWEEIGAVKSYGHNSLTHGNAMNLALTLIDCKSDIIILCDADTAVTYDGWDSIITELFHGRNQYDVVSWGLGLNQRPSVFFFAFKPDLVDMACLDFRPYNIPGEESVKRLMIRGDAASALHGIPSGAQVKCDTGWRLRFDLKLAGCEWYCMNQVENIDKGHQLPDTKESIEYARTKPGHMDEWHYKHKLFGTHKQASRNHPIDGEYGKIWRERVEQYLYNQIKGK